jgi:hypothetical protein
MVPQRHPNFVNLLHLVEALLVGYLLRRHGILYLTSIVVRFPNKLETGGHRRGYGTLATTVTSDMIKLETG